jgi:hypothetical protein
VLPNVFNPRVRLSSRKKPTRLLLFSIEFGLAELEKSALRIPRRRPREIIWIYCRATQTHSLFFSSNLLRLRFIFVFAGWCFLCFSFLLFWSREMSEANFEWTNSKLHSKWEINLIQRYKKKPKSRDGFDFKRCEKDNFDKQNITFEEDLIWNYFCPW